MQPTLHIKKYWWFIIVSLVEIPIFLYALMYMVKHFSLYFMDGNIEKSSLDVGCTYPEGFCPSLSGDLPVIVWLIASIITYLLISFNVKNVKWVLCLNFLLFLPALIIAWLRFFPIR